MNKLEILLVEDNPAYVKLLDFAFREFFELPYEFRHLLDGESAISYLHSLSHQALYSSQKLPRFVLLDLNLPGKKGTDVLEEIRASQFFKDMPVFILTSSEESKEKERCFELGAQKYFVKPIEYDGLEQLVKKLRQLGSSMAAA